MSNKYSAEMTIDEILNYGIDLIKKEENNGNKDISKDDK